MNVEIYLRPNSPPCDEARATLLAVQKEIPFELLEVDIERDPVLRERYADEIPVVFVDGKAWFKRSVERSALASRLERARSFSMGTLDPQKTLSRTAPVSRGTKVGFAVAVVLAVSAVFAGKAYTRLVLDRQRAREGLELTPQNRPAPDFALSGPEGSTVNISSFKGKVVLVNFYATWCGPCREEVPSLDALAKEVAGEPIAIVAIDAEEDWGTIRKFFGAQQPAFSLALDPTGSAVDAYEQRPKGAMFPETYFVDPSFQVVAKVEGPRTWTDPAMVRYLRDLAGGGR